jgi:hypothetical protein
MERLQLYGRVPVCRHCGMPGAHFVGPSFGESGFYICEPKESCDEAIKHREFEAS